MAKAAAKKSTAASKSAGPKKMSAYNTFMKDEVPKVKKANPSLSHKDAFKVAAANWKTSSANPNRGK